MPVVGLFLDPKRWRKSWRTSRICENLAYEIWCIFSPTFTSSILPTMFTGVCGLPEKLSIALVLHSYVLRMIMKLAYKVDIGTSNSQLEQPLLGTANLKCEGFIFTSKRNVAWPIRNGNAKLSLVKTYGMELTSYHIEKQTWPHRGLYWPTRKLNTCQKTDRNVKLLESLLQTKNDWPETEKIPPKKVDKYSCKLVIPVHTKFEQ